MVIKYVIMADSSIGFDTPRQLSVVNGEPLIKRTIRLLKENGVKDILITSHDKRFNNLGVKRYEPKNNYYIPDYSDYHKNKGYWLNAFTEELINQPICFLFGDVYYSENAIKTIVNTDTNSTMFFCTYNNKDRHYIKEHDEPLAYKVVDYKLFKKHIDIVKKLKDEGKCCREPIVWELYRSINKQDINIHKMADNYIAINDESCDIDTLDDIIKLNEVIGGMKMIKCEAIKEFTLGRYDELKNIQRKSIEIKGKLLIGDTFECEKDLADYLLGKNDKNMAVVKVIEIEPEKEIEDGTLEHPYKTIMPQPIKEEKPKTSKKKKSSKK